MAPDLPVLPIDIETARALYAGNPAAHDFEHVLRVFRLAELIANAEHARREVVLTAALLHDVGSSAGRDDHHLRGAAMARELLQGSPMDFVEAVAHAIEAHRFRKEPEPTTLEARVLSDADKLDAIGAIGIARAFAFAGGQGSDLWREPWRGIESAVGDAAEGPVALGTARTPGHEFVFKLLRIPDRLYTASARAIAAKRIEFMVVFFDKLDSEVRGDD